MKVEKSRWLVSAAGMAVLATQGCSRPEEQAADTTVPPAAVPAAQEAPIREITNLAGDLYRFRNNNHYSIFLVTPEGVILADPISAEASTWLKAEIAQRFNVPVRYVLYSHHHWDHASGAAVFNDTAELVGHENMPKAIQATSAALTGNTAAQDKNGNGQIERDEAGGVMSTQFDFIDRNSDGAITAAEVMADVLPPEVTYAGRRTITLGGKSVELVHPGPNHSNDGTVLLFPAERVAFGVDFVAVKRVPGGLLGEASLDNWVDALKTVEALDFDTVVPGHGAVGSKADFSAYRQYFEDLRNGVAAGIAAGHTVEELQASDMLSSFSAFENYETGRNQNIAQAYQLEKGGA